MWPAFAQSAVGVGTIRWLSAESWLSDADVATSIGGVPERLAQPGSSRMADGINVNFDITYPPVWPFGPTHDPRSGSGRTALARRGTADIQ